MKKTLLISTALVFIAAGNCPSGPTPPAPPGPPPPAKACAQLSGNDCKADARCELDYKNSCVNKGASVLPAKCKEITNLDRCPGAELNARSCAKTADGSGCRAAALDDVLAVGLTFGCVVDPTGKLNCWGSVNQATGLIPDNLKNNANSTLAVWANANETFACAMTSTKALSCWGRASDAEMEKVPAPFTSPAGVNSANVGNGQICVIAANGSTNCWGASYTNPPPERQAANSTRRVIVGRLYANCAITSNGITQCWGDNSRGQANIPSRFTKPNSTRSLGIGDATICGVGTDGVTECWSGSNSLGQQDIVPKFKQPNSTLRICSANDYSCALGTDGTIDCWGSTGPLVPIINSIPPAFKNPGGAVAVACSKNAACGIAPDGSVTCWGAPATGVISNFPAAGVKVSVE